MANLFFCRNERGRKERGRETMKREAKDEGKEERKGRRILNFAKGFNYEWRRDPAPWEKMQVVVVVESAAVDFA